MPPEGLVVATTFEDIAKAEQLAKETAAKIDPVLDEIIGLRGRLVSTIEAGPVEMKGVANASAQGTLVRAGSGEAGAQGE